MVVEKDSEVIETEEETVKEPAYLTKEDFNIALNGALNARFKTFEEKLSKPQVKEEKKEPDKVTSAELIEMRELHKKQLEKEKRLILKSRDSHLKNQVKEQLTLAGVPPQFLKAALATVLSDELVDFADDSDDDDMEPQIVFKTVTGNTSLSFGIKNHWLKTEDSKVFLSASNTKGSGDKNYKNTKPTNVVGLGDIGRALLKNRGTF